jgi:hypothetical protein
MGPHTDQRTRGRVHHLGLPDSGVGSMVETTVEDDGKKACFGAHCNPRRKLVEVCILEVYVSAGIRVKDYVLP